LDHSHVQVITLCLEEVPAPIKQVCQHTIPQHEMRIQLSQNGKDSLSYTGSNIMDKKVE
jgi:predicted transcriptional regulator